jgi:two-component system, OmpR family, sensor kinase
MSGKIDPKWRPPLALVLGGGIAAVLALPLAGLLALRALAPLYGFRHSALMIAGVILIAAAILGWLQWRLLLRPIRALSARAEAVRQGAAPPAPLPHYGTRELRDLGQSVLDMTATLQTREAAIRSFADHVTHEMKTPLTAIAGAAELLEESTQDSRLITTIQTATRRMEAQLTALQRSAAARSAGYHGRTTLAAHTATLASAFPVLTLHVSGADQPLPLSPDGVDIVLQHLLQNAFAHGATTITLTATPGQLHIHDNGTGVSDGNRARIFDPFFTTRREGGGTGMGLTIVQNLLGAHGATIRHIPSNHGAAFEIAFAG